MPNEELVFAQQLGSNASNTSINQFNKWLLDGSLILRPPYQRNMVWNTDQSSLLIDSILRGLPVPEVYVVKATDSDGAEEIFVVDGQQRITACLRFIRNEFAMSDGDDVHPDWRGQLFEGLNPRLKARFRKYQLVTRELPDDLDDPAIREIFRRLNKTVESLVAQELRHAAYSGPFLQLVEHVAQAATFSAIGVFSASDYLRRRNDEFIAEICQAALAGAFPNKKEGLEELFLTFENQGAMPGELEQLRTSLARAIGTISPIAAALRRTRFRNKSDLYSLLVALARNAERTPRSDEASQDLAERLSSFSDLVNQLKTQEVEAGGADRVEHPTDHADAEKYLRAVERAATDRLNRVRRDQALSAAVLEPWLSAGWPPHPLDTDDEEALRPEDRDDHDEEPDDSVASLVAARSALLEADVPKVAAGD